MERCPTCRARLKGAEICPRCQTDLTQSIKVIKRAAFLSEHALSLLKQKEIKLAVVFIKESLKLHRSQEALKVRRSLIEFLEQRAVYHLHHGRLQRAKEAIKLTLSLKKTPIALALYAFVTQKEKVELLVW